MSISSGIVENFSLLVPDGAHLDSNGVIANELYVCPTQPKGLEFGNDTWREALHTLGNWSDLLVFSLVVEDMWGMHRT